MSLQLREFLSSPLGRFKCWKTPDGRCPQGAFLRSAGTHDNTVFRSGNRVGKTTIGAVNAGLLAIVFG